MGNKWILFVCFGIIALFVASCSYASNETDILTNTVDDTVSINTTSLDLESDNYDDDSFEDMNSDIDNISIYYGERIDIDWDFDEHSTCTVYIDNKMVSFISDLRPITINMYNYDYTQHENFLNSIYPDVGLHNMSITFEFDTPQKYDLTMETYKYEFDEPSSINNVLWFHFDVNENLKAKKQYSYNTTLNIIKKDKTVHINNISSAASYTNPLCYEVIVDNPDNSSFIFISNKTGIVISDTSFGYAERTYSFDALRHKIKPGIYNLTVVNEYDNTFDTASFTLCNDIIIYTTYKIKDNDVILNVELCCEYDTPIEFSMFKLINGTPYAYRTITKEILANRNDHRFNFEICFDNIDNNDYYVSISDYWSTIDFFNFTINYNHVNETGTGDNIYDVNKTVNVSDSIIRNISRVYNDSNVDDNGTNDYGVDLDLKENSTNFNPHRAYKSNVVEVISNFGDLISSVDSTSKEDANPYELTRKSALNSSKILIIIFLFIVLISGFLKFKREY